MNIKIEINTDGEAFNDTNSDGGLANRLFDVMTQLTRNSPFWTFPSNQRDNIMPIVDRFGNRCGTVTITESED